MASRYWLRVAETLDPAWTAWLDNLTVTHNADGSTTLSGCFTEQAALFQLLHKMGELGMTLLAVGPGQEAVDGTVSTDDTVIPTFCSPLTKSRPKDQR